MENVIENNKLIAEFMGFDGQHEEWCGNNILEMNGLGFEEMRPYRPESNWGDLMPVVEKIARIPFEEEENTAHARTFGMLNEDGKIMVRLNRFQLHIADTLIESTYGAVLEYINWYNDNQNPQPNESN